MNIIKDEQIKETNKKECPFANLTYEIDLKEMKINNTKESNTVGCPFHNHSIPNTFKLQTVFSPDVTFDEEYSSQILKDIGGGDRIREFCTRFYAHAFLDLHIKPFFFMDDGATSHAKRLADWVIEKMGGEGKPWSDSGRYGIRQETHARAWYSQKREPKKRGQRFKLDDSRIWMRLHFWAARQCGLSEHKVFWEWYQNFIEEFIGVYESQAVYYVSQDASWSASEKNIKTYIDNGYKMSDVIGKK